MCNQQPKSCPRLRGKWHEVPKGVRLGRWVSRERKPEGLHRGCSFFRQPLSRLAATAPRPGSLLVQCKHIVQCRTPRGAIVSMGLRGVQGGLRGEIEIFPGPHAKKHYILPSSSSSQRFFTRKVATWLPWLPRPKPSSAPLARACAEAT